MNSVDSSNVTRGSQSLERRFVSPVVVVEFFDLFDGLNRRKSIQKTEIEKASAFIMQN